MPSEEKREVPFLPSTIETIDYALFDWLDNRKIIFSADIGDFCRYRGADRCKQLQFLSLRAGDHMPICQNSSIVVNEKARSLSRTAFYGDY